MPPRLVQVENWVTPGRICFSREGGSQREWGIDPDAGISPSAYRMGKHAPRHTSTEKYTNENIYAMCQSSVGYLAWK